MNISIDMMHKNRQAAFFTLAFVQLWVAVMFLAPEPYGRVVANLWLIVLGVNWIGKEPFTPTRFQMLMDALTGLTIYYLFAVVGTRYLGGPLKGGEILAGGPHDLEGGIIVGVAVAIIASGFVIKAGARRFASSLKSAPVELEG